MLIFIELEFSKDDFVYVFDMLCKYGYVKVVMEVFNKRKWGFDFCVKVYMVLMCGWCKMKRVDMVERLLREMVEKGIEFSVICYNVLFDGICWKLSLYLDD